MHRYPVVKKNVVVRLPKNPASVAKPAAKPRAPMRQQPIRRLPEVQVIAPQQRLIYKNKPTIKYLNKDAAPISHTKLLGLRGKFAGRALVIVANGPSIMEADLHKLKNLDLVDIMSINKPDSRLWPTTHWLFCDSSQFRRHHDLWADYNGYIFNSTAINQQKNNSIQIKNIPKFGFSRDLIKGMHIGRSSVYAAMQVALWLGYHAVYIFGVDMCEVNGKLHFYGVNPDVDQQRRKNKFSLEAEYYDYAAGALSEDEKSRFYFCSEYNKWPFVLKYNNMSQKAGVNHILESDYGR